MIDSLNTSSFISRIIVIMATLGGFQAAQSQSTIVPYTRMVIRGAIPSHQSRGSVKCSDVFSSQGDVTVVDSLYKESTTRRDKFEIPILRRLDGDYPYRLEVRVSLFFKMKDIPYRGPVGEAVAGTTIADKVNQPSIELLSRWSEEFGRSEEGVAELANHSLAVDPLRKTHIGYRVEDVSWAGVDLFDGSSTLRLFDQYGELGIVESLADNRSELELRFPDLLLPERVRQEQGEDVQVFFISRRTTLDSITQVYNNLAQRLALQILMKTNSHLLQRSSRILRQWEAPVSHRLPLNINYGRMYKHQIWESSAGLQLEDVSEAIHNSFGVRIYTSANQRISRILKREGWKEFERQPKGATELTVLYMDASEFIAKHLSRNITESDEARVTDLGKETDEFQRSRRKLEDAYRRALRRHHSLERARKQL